MLDITNISKDSNKKADFVDQLCNFYKTSVNTTLDIDYMKYVEVGGHEWVYVVFKSGSAKKFSVWGDNNQGILIDFVHFIQNFKQYDWIF